MKQTNQERIQQLQQEIVYETKARDSGVRLGLSLILILSTLSLGITIAGIILHALNAGIILHPLNAGTIWDIIICLINLATAIGCLYGLAGRDREVALFIDRAFGLNILTEKRN